MLVLISDRIRFDEFLLALPELVDKSYPVGRVLAVQGIEIIQRGGVAYSLAYKIL
jgi:hypothetical protein